MFVLKSHWWGKRLSLVPLNTCQVCDMCWMAVPHGVQSHAKEGRVFRVCKKRLQETTRGHHKGFVENRSVAKITVLEPASTTWRAWKLTGFWWNMQKLCKNNAKITAKEHQESREKNMVKHSKAKESLTQAPRRPMSTRLLPLCLTHAIFSFFCFILPWAPKISAHQGAA